MQRFGSEYCYIFDPFVQSLLLSPSHIPDIGTLPCVLVSEVIFFSDKLETMSVPLYMILHVDEGPMGFSVSVDNIST